MKKDTIIANDIYDLIRGTMLFDDPNRDTTEWGKLTRKHHNEARKSMRDFVKNKNIELENNTIKIGKRITITIN